MKMSCMYVDGSISMKILFQSFCLGTFWFGHIVDTVFDIDCFRCPVVRPRGLQLLRQDGPGVARALRCHVALRTIPRYPQSQIEKCCEMLTVLGFKEFAMNGKGVDKRNLMRFMSTQIPSDYSIPLPDRSSIIIRAYDFCSIDPILHFAK